MTATDKRNKILTLAADRAGWPCDIYPDVCKELAAEGLIEQRAGRSVMSGFRSRWFLKQAVAA